MFRRRLLFTKQLARTLRAVKFLPHCHHRSTISQSLSTLTEQIGKLARWPELINDGQQLAKLKQLSQHIVQRSGSRDIVQVWLQVCLFLLFWFIFASVSRNNSIWPKHFARLTTSHIQHNDFSIWYFWPKISPPTSMPPPRRRIHFWTSRNVPNHTMWHCWSIDSGSRLGPTIWNFSVVSLGSMMEWNFWSMFVVIYSQCSWINSYYPNRSHTVKSIFGYSPLSSPIYFHFGSRPASFVSNVPPGTRPARSFKR